MGDPVSIGMALAAIGAKLGSTAGAAALPSLAGLSGASAAAAPLQLAGTALGGTLGGAGGYFGGRALGNLMQAPPELPGGIPGASPPPTHSGIQAPKFDFGIVSAGNPRSIWEELYKRRLG